MNKLITIGMALAIGGCATCREYPVSCAVVTGIVATSIAISVDQHNNGDRLTTAPLHRRFSPCQPLGVTPCVP